jgi:hypothetical protein
MLEWLLTEVQETEDLQRTKHFPDGNILVYSEEVKIRCSRKDFYPNLENPEVQIYDGLAYRHWTLGMKANLIMYWQRLMRMQELISWATKSSNSPHLFDGDEDYLWSPTKNPFT